MKKVMLIIVGLILVACAILWMKGNAVREISTQIDISAPPEKVWSTLSDIEQWHKWNSIVIQASGMISVGSELTITMRGEDGQDGPKYRPIIIGVQEARLLEWKAKMMAEFIFTNGRVFKLEKTHLGTRLTNTETFRGMLVPLFWGKLNSHVPLMLAEMNRALKNEVEKKPQQ